MKPTDRRALINGLLVLTAGCATDDAVPTPSPESVVAVSLADEVVGSEPRAFLAMAGNWSVVDAGGGKAIQVDGTAWEPGTPPSDLAGKATELFPDSATFPNRMRGALNFQLAVARDVPDFRAGRIETDFKLVGGASDQYASIMFGMGPDANHYALRYNTKDGDVALWQVVDGQRQRLQHGGIPVEIPLGEWHTLELVVTGTRVRGVIDGQEALDYTLPAPVSGRVGYWTKPDSVTAFRGFAVSR